MPSCTGESAIFTRKRTSSMFKPIMSNVLQECLRSIHESDSGIAIDFLSFSFAHGVDCITATVLGLPQATSFVLDTQKCDYRLALYLRSHPPELTCWMQELPNLMNWLVGIGIPILSKSYQTAKEVLESWVPTDGYLMTSKSL